MTGRTFNIAVAFEPSASGGPALAESTFHHFADYNSSSFSAANSRARARWDNLPSPCARKPRSSSTCVAGISHDLLNPFAEPLEALEETYLLRHIPLDDLLDNGIEKLGMPGRIAPVFRHPDHYVVFNDTRQVIHLRRGGLHLEGHIPTQDIGPQIVRAT